MTSSRFSPTRMPPTSPVSMLALTTKDEVTSAPFSLMRTADAGTFFFTVTRTRASPPLIASGRLDSTSIGNWLSP